MFVRRGTVIEPLFHGGEQDRGGVPVRRTSRSPLVSRAAELPSPSA
jgi:hypothetical protein